MGEWLASGVFRGGAEDVGREGDSKGCLQLKVRFPARAGPFLLHPVSLSNVGAGMVHGAYFSIETRLRLPAVEMVKGEGAVCGQSCSIASILPGREVVGKLGRESARCLMKAMYSAIQVSWMR